MTSQLYPGTKTTLEFPGLIRTGHSPALAQNISLQPPAQFLPVGGAPPRPLVGDRLLLVSGNFHLTLYSASGAVVFDFQPSPDRISMQDGDLTQATVGYVSGMFQDSDGSVYFTDEPDRTATDGDTLIRRLTLDSATTGTITTLPALPPVAPGSNSYQALTECGIVKLGDSIYTADSWNGLIWKTPALGGRRTAWSLGSVLAGPCGLSLGPITGHLYTADYDLGEVFELDPSGTVTLCSADPGLYNALALTTDGSYLYVATSNEAGAGGLARVAETGVTDYLEPEDGSSPVATFDNQTLYWYAPDGKLYYTASRSGSPWVDVLKLDGALDHSILLALPVASSDYFPRNILVLPSSSLGHALPLPPPVPPPPPPAPVLSAVYIPVVAISTSQPG